MRKGGVLGSLMMTVAIIFFVASVIWGEGRAVNIALGVVFLLLAINAKRRGRA